MVMSDFRMEVLIWPFCACTMKNMDYNPYVWTNRQNSRVLQEMGVKEVDSDVRFQTRIRNMVVSRMRNEKYALFWTRQWGRYHVPQNVFLVLENKWVL